MEFEKLGELYEQLEKLTKRKEMVRLLADFLRDLRAEEAGPACSMFLGPAFSVGWATVRDAVLAATGLKADDFWETFNKTGDLGEATKLLFTRRRVRVVPLTATPLTVLEVWRVLEKLRTVPSLQQKRRLLEGLFNSCSPVGAKFLAKVLTGEMRAGVGEGLLRQALAEVYRVSGEEVKAACTFGSLPQVADALGRGRGLGVFMLRLFQPVSPMLAESARDVSEALREHGGRTFLEFKLDGARVQIHVQREKVAIFTRNRADVSRYMPEIVGQVRELGLREAILEGEVIAHAQGSPLPFQFLMRRFRRKEPEKAPGISLRLCFFDLLYLDGKPMLGEPYVVRRKGLEEIAGERVVERREVGGVEEGEEFLRRALSLGHEGVVAKAPDTSYFPGRREKAWLKIKPVFTLDLVITAAEWGYGRRAGYLSDYYLAALDEKSGKFEVVGKTFKGLTNLELEEMTKRLRALQTKAEGRKVTVRPEIVVEVSFNQVQRSSKYPSGVALRFARIERIRDDKRPEEVDTLERVRELLFRQPS